jgi:hypothetical protein
VNRDQMDEVLAGRRPFDETTMIDDSAAEQPMGDEVPRDAGHDAGHNSGHGAVDGTVDGATEARSARPRL